MDRTVIKARPHVAVAYAKQLIHAGKWFVFNPLPDNRWEFTHEPGVPKPPTPEEILGDEEYVRLAHEQHHKAGEVEVDDNAEVSRGGDAGAYVEAWVWVDGCKLCKAPLADCGCNWNGLCPGCTDRVSDVMDKRHLNEDSAVDFLLGKEALPREDRKGVSTAQYVALGQFLAAGGKFEDWKAQAEVNS